MEKTRVIVNVGVMYNVDTYTAAGEVLDRIDGKLREALLDTGGKHEITGFQTRPCKAATFDQMAYGRDAGPPIAQEVSPDRF